MTIHICILLVYKGANTSYISKDDSLTKNRTVEKNESLGKEKVLRLKSEFRERDEQKFNSSFLEWEFLTKLKEDTKKIKKRGDNGGSYLELW